MAQDNLQILLASKDLESSQFDPISLINELLPNEQSLSDIDIVIGKVQSSMQKLDEDIRRDVRFYSTQRTKATTAFKCSQISISELFEKIHEIKAKAEKSENMVQEICKDIKTLDHAKVHITASIKTLRRLQMLVSAVDQLRSRATARQYREAGNLLEAINQLAPAFLEFRTISKIAELNSEITIFKTNLTEQSKEEFRMYDRQINSNLTGGPVTPNLLRDVCFVVLALGQKTQQDFINWFVETQLQDYRASFPENSEVSRLDHVERRYAWLMRELRYLDEVYAKIFPEEWKMTVKIAVEFSITTRLEIAALLEASKNNLDVAALVAALRKTVEFEKDISAKLYEYERAKHPRQEEVAIVETGNLDDEQADGFLVKFSAEAIKQKWEKHLQQKEKAELAHAAKTPTALAAETLANQFKGMISTCFDPYMDHYIHEEDRTMHRLLEKIIQEETWITPVSPNNKVLLSSADLIYYFNEARKKCAPLTKGQPFYDLFLLFKKYLNAYASILHNKIEEHPISSPKALSDTDELATIMIINTAEYCAATTTQIAQIVSKIIDQKFVEKIDLSAEGEAFSGVTARGLKSLANHIEGKVEGALQAMAKIKWGEVEQVGEQSNYVSEIGEVLKSILPRFKIALSNAHFNFVCDLFVTSFVSRGIIQNLYKCKLISNDGAHQLLLDVATIKDALLHIVGYPPPTRFAKLVSKEFGRVESILKLLNMPNDAIVQGYYTMIPDGSDSDMQRILALKGMKRDDRHELLQRLLHPSSIPLPSLASSSSPRSMSPVSSADSSSLSVPHAPLAPPSPTVPSFFSSAPSTSVTPSAIRASLKNFLPGNLF